MALFLFLVLLSYLLGSIPTGYLMGRVLKGIDIREFGSGNVGATNVFRVLGKGPGIVTMAIDIFKGFIPVFIAAQALNLSLPQASIIGIAAIAGHNWTVFLQFRGGKGVATSAGVCFALMPIPLLIALGAFLLSLLLTRYVSVSSIFASLVLCATAFLMDYSGFMKGLAVLCAFLILVSHRKNVARLMKGEEPKVPLWKKGEPS